MKLVENTDNSLNIISSATSDEIVVNGNTIKESCNDRFVIDQHDGGLAPHHVVAASRFGWGDPVDLFDANLLVHFSCGREASGDDSSPLVTAPSTPT